MRALIVPRPDSQHGIAQAADRPKSADLAQIQSFDILKEIRCEWLWKIGSQYGYEQYG